MEDETRWFFIVIVQTVSSLVLWMLVNILCGLYFGLALFNERPTWKNYIYYAIALASFIWLVKYFIKKWKTVKRF
jgi:hypothetical protein